MFISKIDIRTIIAFMHDIVAVGFAWWLAYLFRFNFDIPSSVSVILISTLPWIVLTQTSFFYGLGCIEGSGAMRVYLTSNASLLRY